MSARRADTLPPPPPTLLIVGRGRVGPAIARTAAEAGLTAILAGRDDVAARAVGVDTALLCVPDGAIADACEAVVGAAPALRAVGHTSGAATLAPLRPATRAGMRAFSLHPLQTIPDGTAELIGAPAAIAGSDSQALSLARGLAERIGMTPFEVPEDSRGVYHAAAAMASNFLVALESSAVEVLDAAGIEGGRELLVPLVLRSAANWAEAGDAALTGPIARGDEATVERHREALAACAPHLLELYAALAERTRAIAREGARA